MLEAYYSGSLVITHYNILSRRQGLQRIAAHKAHIDSSCIRLSFLDMDA